MWDTDYVPVDGRLTGGARGVSYFFAFQFYLLIYFSVLLLLVLLVLLLLLLLLVIEAMIEAMVVVIVEYEVVVEEVIEVAVEVETNSVLICGRLSSGRAVQRRDPASHAARFPAILFAPISGTPGHPRALTEPSGTHGTPSLHNNGNRLLQRRLQRGTVDP
jgi:hypothetical protein